MTSLELSKKMVEILDKKKAAKISVLEIRGLTILGDYFVLASGNSTTQVKALAEEAEDELSKMGLEPKRVEGHQSAQWILLDYYDVILHIFTPETRDFYGMDRLWADAPQVDISGLVHED